MLTHTERGRCQRSSLRALAVFAAALACCGCQSDAPAAARSTTAVLTPLHYVAMGVQGVERYLDAAPPTEAAWIEDAIATARDSVVFIEVRTAVEEGFWETSFTSNHGSGVVLETDGIVLTAGHMLSGKEPEARFFVTRGSERELTAEPAQWEYEQFSTTGIDRGALRVSWDRPYRGVLPAEPVPGELLLGAGFPDGYGITEQRTIATASHARGPLAPVPYLARVFSVEPLLLDLVAGAMPPVGMSGSPLLNSSGECVGLLSGIRIEYSGGEVSSTRIAASRLPGLEAAPQ